MSSVGASVSLTCLVEPVPRLDKVVWTKGSNNRKIVPNSEYTVYQASRDSSAELTIEEQQQQQQTQNHGGNNNNKKNSNNNIKVKFESLMLHGGKLDDYSTSEDTMMMSSVVNYGTKSGSGGGSWDDDGDLIEGVTSTDELGKSATMLKSVLTIRHVRKQDFGVYRCKASNVYGSRRVVIVLREKSLMGEELSLFSCFLFLS